MKYLFFIIRLLACVAVSYYVGFTHGEESTQLAVRRSIVVGTLQGMLASGKFGENFCGDDLREALAKYNYSAEDLDINPEALKETASPELLKETLKKIVSP